MDTTPGSKDAAKPRPGYELALPATEETKPYVAAPPEDDIELEQDFELAAELEVGLAGENLLGAPDPLASETGEVEGSVQPPNGNGIAGSTPARAGSTLDTWGGNQLFNLVKNIVGATNSLHYTVLEGGLLNPLYSAVTSDAEKVYNNIYARLFGLVALVRSIMMFRNIWRGDLAAVSKRALYALAGVCLAASSLAMLRYFDPIDNAIVQTAGPADANLKTCPTTRTRTRGGNPPGRAPRTQPRHRPTRPVPGRGHRPPGARHRQSTHPAGRRRWTCPP
jgi:hypothetical protein